jgi:hypothetical protein
LGSEIKTRSAALAKILGGEVAESPESEEMEAVKDSRPAVPSPMLDLVMRSGCVESFGYAYLSRVSFDPRGRLLLHFGDDIAVLEGRNMHEIQQKVRMHRATEIREGIEAEEALKAESAPHVDSIVITSKDEMEERKRETRRSKSTH